jgi:hypothetical protein
MPRLGSLLVCEKIILDQQQKPSLISIFQGITALVPQGQQMPKDALGGTPWCIFCEWFFAEDELTKMFEQVIEVLMPDGSPSLIKGRLTFQQLAKDQGTRSYVSMYGMPIANPGFLTVNVWLESESVKVTDVFSYPVKIDHTTEPRPNETAMIIPTLSQTKPK